MKQLLPPVQYYGGKSGMAREITALFPEQGSYSTFVEVFGGGMSVLLSQEKKCPIEVYNDLGDNICALYRVIQDERLFHEMKRVLDTSPYSRSLHDSHVARLGRKDISDLERAISYFYVNRSSFNGVAGFSKSKHPRRNMSKSIACYLAAIDRLPEIHERISSVIIEHSDWSYILDSYDGADTLMYVDPPYLHSTRSTDTRYEVEMTDEEHRRLCEKLVTMKAKLIVSGYDNQIYREILEPRFSRIETISKLSQSKTPEIIWKNY